VATPGSTWIFRFNIANLPLVNLIYPRETVLLGPRRGYCAIGPVLEGWVTNGGNFQLTGSNQTWMNALATALAANLTNAIPPALFIPVRARVRNIAGVFTLLGFGPVQSVAWRTRMSFRRSRMPEA
jgi:hypothetical protein